MQPTANDDWLTYRDPSGFSLKYPPQWQAFRHQTGAAMVTSPDGNAFLLIQQVPQPPGCTAADIVRFGRFPAAALFTQGQPGGVETTPSGQSSCEVRFMLSNRVPALALVTCKILPHNALITVLAGALPNGLTAARPLLEKIRDSYAATAAPPVPPQTVQPAAPSYTRYTDPQMGTFNIDVPQGWRVNGGFRHAGLGDRRIFVEVLSPEGVAVLFGDPDCPQVFYQNPMSFGESFVTYPTGCCFLNLQANGKKLAAWYLKNLAPRRLGPIQPSAERDRPDFVAAAKRRDRQLASFAVTAYEINFRCGARTGRCLAVTQSNGGSFIGDNWAGNVVVWLAPPGLEALADQVATHMIESFQITPQFNQIVNRDEAIIAGNGNVALAGQQQWFAAQQGSHFAQQQAGDAIINRYWDQQRANDSMMRSWEQSQSTYDGIFQRQSDATLGQERLYDDVIGKEYYASAGANYYWIDSTTGSVIGTNTETPPDYSRDYRLLKKL